MQTNFTTPLALALSIALGTTIASPAAAASNPDAASATTSGTGTQRDTEAPEIAELRAQIAELNRRLEELAQQTTEARDSAQRADENAAIAVQTAANGNNALTDARTVSRLAGYGFVNFTAPQDGNAGFSTAAFNPIFQVQYGDNILFESELELAVEDSGETEVNLEYVTISWLFNDHAALVVGRFLSPLGNFRQNVHPAWINRFASAPAGFGHDGAAPVADLGAQIRGAWATAGLGKFNYAAYVANGPELEAEEDVLEGVKANGTVRNVDGNLVLGGRVGWLPVPTLELGVSFANGRTSVTEVEGAEIDGEPSRNYRFYGGDFAWRPMPALELRGEYARQRAGEAASSIAPDSASWRAWYAQAAYRITGTPWELVGRLGDFESVNEMMSTSQWGAGLNYWLTPSTVFKAAYEFNDPDLAMSPMKDTLILQVAHGF